MLPSKVLCLATNLPPKLPSANCPIPHHSTFSKCSASRFIRSYKM